MDVWGEVGGGEEEKREDVLQELQAEDGGNGLQVELTFRQEVLEQKRKTWKTRDAE